jgi:hypothetical protein
VTSLQPDVLEEMSMWVVVARREQQAATYWPGRRSLALVDALIWPAALAYLVTRVPFATGAVGAVALALCLLCALRRSHRAVWTNERYWFTTWRLGVAVAWFMAFGWALRLAL